MRNAEVIRQWKILKTIEAGPLHQLAPKLADEHGVTERTIRRDIEALQEAGFPLYDDRARRQEGLAPRRGLQAAPDPELHARGARGPLLQPQPAVVPGRRALRPGPGVGLRQDPRGAAREEPAVPRAHPGPVLGAARPLEGLLEEAGRDRGAHRRDAPPAPGADRVLLLQQPAHEVLHARPLPARLLPRRALPLRARPRVRRGAHVRGRADRSRSRCSSRTSRCRPTSTPRSTRVGAFGIVGGKPQTVELALRGGDGRLHPRAQSGTRARRSRTSPTARSAHA